MPCWGSPRPCWAGRAWPAAAAGCWVPSSGAVSIYLLQQLLTASGVAPSLIQFAYGAVLVVGVVLGATLLAPRLKRNAS